MNEKYNVYLVSDSTGETLDRIFLSLKSQFANFEYDKKEFAFVRTEQQINKIIEECSKVQNSIILYTIVEIKLAKYIANTSQRKNVPCFGILGNLILSFSKLLNQKAIHKPSAQHVLDDDYYNRTEAIQRTLRSLDEFVLEGIVTTIDLHKKILNHKKFIESDFDTNWLSKEKFY